MATETIETVEILHRRLVDAIFRGSLADIESTVKAGADIHINEDVALRLASSENNTNIVLYLVRNGADVQADNNYPLRMAARYGNADLIDPLLAAGADIYDADAITHASMGGHTDIVRRLMEHEGPPPCTTDTALAWMQENDYLPDGANAPPNAR